jgi:hypothetical protein
LETQFIPEQKVVALKQLWFLKEQIQKYARKHINGGIYLKVTLGHRELWLKFRDI